MIFKSPYFLSVVFDHLFPSLIKLSTETFIWSKTDKTPTFAGIPPLVIILTMLEVIRKAQNGMKDEVSGNIIVGLIKRGTFCGFSE